MVELAFVSQLVNLLFDFWSLKILYRHALALSIGHCIEQLGFKSYMLPREDIRKKQVKHG